MIKKEIYPKTQRLKCEGSKIYITEKLDGSNLCIFKLNDELYMAQRKNIFTLSEFVSDYISIKPILYKGLYEWLNNYGTILKDNLHNGSALCGEWLGMGALKYPVDEFDKRFYMFAKANINENFELYNIKYDHDLFIYPFIDEQLPYFIGIVPEVTQVMVLPNKDYLDSIYQKYCQKVNRNVEGFVINYANNIEKYVRMKNGDLKEHFDRES